MKKIEEYIIKYLMFLLYSIIIAFVFFHLRIAIALFIYTIFAGDIYKIEEGVWLIVNLIDMWFFHKIIIVKMLVYFLKKIKITNVEIINQRDFIINNINQIVGFAYILLYIYFYFTNVSDFYLYSDFNIQVISLYFIMWSLFIMKCNDEKKCN